MIYSNFFLHLSPNFENILKNINFALKSDGFLIITIPETNNIYELTKSMYKTDLNLYNGVYQRANPTVSIENLLDYLKKLNFNIPTINSDNFRIEYSKFENLLSDLKSTNLSYCYKDKKNNFENKNYFKVLKKIYMEDYFDDCFILNIKFNVISAWKK